MPVGIGETVKLRGLVAKSLVGPARENRGQAPGLTLRGYPDNPVNRHDPQPSPKH